jgi:lipopolysaccharide/colanic/teichoic acid biosynthesis glycosyltransferase
MQWGVPSATAQMDWSKLAPSTASSHHAFRWSPRRAVVVAALMTCDYLAAAIAVAASEILVPPASWAWAEGALVLFAALAPLHAFIGLYGCWGPCPIARLRLRALGAMGLGVAMVAVTAAWNSTADMAAIGVVTALLFIIGYYLEGMARLPLMQSGLWGAPTVLIGSPEQCAQLARTLLEQPKLGLNPIGIVCDPPESGQWPDTALPVLCGMADMHRLPGVVEVAIIAEGTGGIPNLGLRTRNLGSAVGLEVRFDLFRSGNLAVKRAVDLLVAIPATIVAAPLIAILALAIKFADPGPAFYRQRRVGRDGRVLNVLKLRTMYGNAEERLREHLQDNPDAQAEWARFFKLSADPRVLPAIGHFLRRSSLDELPQLWNILRGEMSLVGPRPFPDYHMNSFDTAFQTLRVSVPPGLTGLWQVSSRSGGDIDVQQEQDLFYIRNWSIWLDLYIIIETFPAVFTARGAK